MSAEGKGKIETYEGGSVLPPGVHDSLIKSSEPEPEEEQDFDPEWFLCQTAVTLVGKFYFKDELKIGDGQYGKYCSFSLRTKKLKNGKPWTYYFYVKVWGNDMISLLEKLPNETFVKVTGDLETFRNSTYIRARTITPLLNLDQHVEELKQKEMFARMENDGAAMEETRIAREAIGEIAQKARTIVESADGDGYAEMPDSSKNMRTDEPRFFRGTPERSPDREKEPFRRNTGINNGTGGEKNGTEGDDKVMAAKEDLAYILDVLEDMEDFDSGEDIEKEEKDTASKLDVESLLSRLAKKDTEDEQSEEDGDEDEDDEGYDEDDEDEEEEEKEDRRVTMVDMRKGKAEQVQNGTLSSFKRKYDKKTPEEEENEERFQKTLDVLGMKEKKSVPKRNENDEPGREKKKTSPGQEKTREMDERRADPGRRRSAFSRIRK